MPITLDGSLGITTPAGLLINNYPAFSAFKSGSNQSISSATATKVTFATEQFDTNSNYDTSTSTFTPTVAGYYQITTSIEALAVSATYYLAQIRKNGTQAINGSNFPTSASAGPCSIATALIYCNGSTDYIEAYVVCSAACTIPGTTESFASKFQGVLVRSA